MNASVFLCQTVELVEGHYCELSVEHSGQTHYLVATRHQGKPKAWLNVCPHQGRALNWAPGRFITDDAGRLVCAAHGAVFEPDQGVCVSGPCLNATLKPIGLVEDSGQVFIDSAA